MMNIFKVKILLPYSLNYYQYTLCILCIAVPYILYKHGHTVIEYKPGRITELRSISQVRISQQKLHRVLFLKITSLSFSNIFIDFLSVSERQGLRRNSSLQFLPVSCAHLSTYQCWLQSPVMMKAKSTLIWCDWLYIICNHTIHWTQYISISELLNGK